MSTARLHPDDVHIDTDLARRLLREQLPSYADLPLRQVSPLGTENVVLRLGDDFAIRMPRHPGAVGGLLTELRCLPKLAAQVSLEVPEVLATGEPSEGYPFPWAVVRWVPGEDALTGRITSMDDAALRLGRFAAELQAQAATGASPDASTRGGPLVGRDEAFREALRQCEGLLDADRVRAVWDDALSVPDWAGAPVWLHADLIPGNIVLRDGRVAGVLDFGAMTVGDPAYDIIPAWFVLDREHRATFFDVVGVDDATRRRARGLVVSQAVIALPYYLHSNPAMVATARRGVEQVLLGE